jgi:hypothetical protein
VTGLVIPALRLPISAPVLATALIVGLNRLLARGQHQLSPAKFRWMMCLLGLCVALPYGVFGRVDGSCDGDFGSGVWSGHGEFALLLKWGQR